VQREGRDVLQQGTKIGTLEEMRRDLRKPHTVVETFQDLAPDLMYKMVCKFGSLDYSDSRDNLYGLIGILDERTRVSVEPMRLGWLTGRVWPFCGRSWMRFAHMLICNMP
jgi:hypothetical protein